MTFWNEINDALGLADTGETAGQGAWPSRYDVTGLAIGAIGAVGSTIASLMHARNLTNGPARVIIDGRLASLWFSWSIHPIEWELPPTWDAIAGDYQTKDGWIKLHTNLPHHRHAACAALGVEADRPRVEQVIVGWEKNALETAIVEAGGVAAAMRSRAEWGAHPQGAAVLREPLIDFQSGDVASLRDWKGPAARPLQGLRVLDLTRVLAGPVATRTLAGFGAEVLRIDPPGWDEPIVVPDITLGKHCARLDLRAEPDRRRFEELLAKADIFIHGLRPGALAGLGFDDDKRKALAPHLIEVTLDAYGWTGPWAGRRGFDSLVQMSSGIADAGREWAGADRPTPLPVQALDHATGYLMAAAALRLLDLRLRGAPARAARLSLARTAALLVQRESVGREEPIGAAGDADFAEDVECTPWGDARRLRAPLTIGETRLHWDRPACALGSARPVWSS